MGRSQRILDALSSLTKIHSLRVCFIPHYFPHQLFSVLFSIILHTCNSVFYSVFCSALFWTPVRFIPQIFDDERGKGETVSAHENLVEKYWDPQKHLSNLLCSKGWCRFWCWCWGWCICSSLCRRRGQQWRLLQELHLQNFILCGYWPVGVWCHQSIPTNTWWARSFDLVNWWAPWVCHSEQHPSHNACTRVQNSCISWMCVHASQVTQMKCTLRASLECLMAKQKCTHDLVFWIVNCSLIGVSIKHVTSVSTTLDGKMKFSSGAKGWASAKNYSGTSWIQLLEDGCPSHVSAQKEQGCTWQQIRSLPFVSNKTFIQAVMSWMASFQLDFWQHIDPWSRHDLKFLACETPDSGQSCHISGWRWGTCAIFPQETLQVLAASSVLWRVLLNVPLLLPSAWSLLWFPPDWWWGGQRRPNCSHVQVHDEVFYDFACLLNEFSQQGTSILPLCMFLAWPVPRGQPHLWKLFQIAMCQWPRGCNPICTIFSTSANSPSKVYAYAPINWNCACVSQP